MMAGPCPSPPSPQESAPLPVGNGSLPVELKLRDNTDYSYSIMSTVDSDAMPREEGVIRISTDGRDERIFFGFKIFISRIFSVRKIWQVFFGWLVLK